jgi:NADH/F420H2 dehydrogenase subunit C
MDIRTPVPTIYGDWLAKFGEAWKSQAEQLRQKLGAAIEEVRMPPEYPTDVPIVYAAKDRVIDVLRFLKTEAGFEYAFLSDLTATDEYETGAEKRFEVVYQLSSIARGWRIRVKARVRDGESLPTAVPLWEAANWAEREVWDMFGIRFEGHPDLRRILMDPRWVGHPLRKDYPIRGYQVFPDPIPVEEKLLE